MYLNIFDFDMVYRKGKDIDIADLMFRTDWKESDDILLSSEGQKEEVVNNELTTDEIDNFKFETDLRLDEKLH